ncbi:MAG: nucleoid-associated protein [Clostridium sp.]|nr:nucleoid-associated protein [Clostridium sp.]
MDFSNLQIKRIVIHEIFERDTEKKIQEPRYGESLSILDDMGIETLEERIINAIGSESNSMEMEIRNTDNGSCVDIVDRLITLDDDEFIEESKKVAYRLAEAQVSRRIPGGVVVVVQGTAGEIVDKNFIVIIKAEIHNGFTRTNNVLSYLSDLLLTPQQKLYKIAAFLESDIKSQDLDKKYELCVYDHNMKRSETKDAATYFYGSFLGSVFKRNSKIVTREFYEATKEIINIMDISDDEKIDLNMGLYTYIKSSVNATISVDEFSNQYIKDELRDNYQQAMREKGIPDTAINKDLTFLNSRLKQRRIKFTSEVSITAPSDKFNDSVKVVECSDEKSIIEIIGKIKEQQ